MQRAREDCLSSGLRQYSINDLGSTLLRFQKSRTCRSLKRPSTLAPSANAADCPMMSCAPAATSFIYKASLPGSSMDVMDKSRVSGDAILGATSTQSTGEAGSL